MATNSEYISWAKLMLSGEYSVKLGATALVLPLKRTQKMAVEAEKESGNIHWISGDFHSSWFEAEIMLKEEVHIRSQNAQASSFLKGLLETAIEMKPDFLHKLLQANTVRVNNDFSRHWGWGSSSAMISNIAQWAEINAWEFHQKVSNGSGYDVLAAQAANPFLYRLKENSYQQKDVNLDFSFADELVFFYQGAKQNSETSLKKFIEQKIINKTDLAKISRISIDLTKSKNLHDFVELMREHEEITSRLTGLESIQRIKYPDYNGVIKSLGAWGGDFALMASPDGVEYSEQYLFDKGVRTYFNWKDIVL